MGCANSTNVDSIHPTAHTTGFDGLHDCSRNDRQNQSLASTATRPQRAERVIVQVVAPLLPAVVLGIDVSDSSEADKGSEYDNSARDEDEDRRARKKIHALKHFLDETPRRDLNDIVTSKRRHAKLLARALEQEREIALNVTQSQGLGYDSSDDSMLSHKSSL